MPRVLREVFESSCGIRLKFGVPQLLLTKAEGLEVKLELFLMLLVVFVSAAYPHACFLLLLLLVAVFFFFFVMLLLILEV